MSDLWYVRTSKRDRGPYDKAKVLELAAEGINQRCPEPFVVVKQIKTNTDIIRKSPVNEITTEQLYDLYLDTARKCTSRINSMSDEDIEYNLYEEFDIGVLSFFHTDSLSRLFDAGKISEKTVSLSKEIREIWIELQTKKWEINEIKKDSDWQKLFLLCDELVLLLKSTN
jgi:hypothetical protein